jgi:hypothetical protein
MARGTGTRRALSEANISELIRGNPEALAAQAAKGGNVQPAPEAVKNLPPAPGEDMLAQKLGVPVDVVRELHKEFTKADKKAVKAGTKEEPHDEKKKNWWTVEIPEREGPGFASLLQERGHGSTNEAMPTPGGGEAAGGAAEAKDGESLAQLIKRRTGTPPPNAPQSPAPSAPSAPSA